MFGKLFGIDKEEMVKDTIQECLINLSQELNCNHNELCVIIKPKDGEFNFDFWLCRMVNNAPQKPIRRIPIKEVLDGPQESKEQRMVYENGHLSPPLDTTDSNQMID